MAVSKDSCTITPKGDIYKCVEMIYEEKMCVGNIAKGYNDNYYNFLRAHQYDDCFSKGCIYIPLCGGGCIRSKELGRNPCHKIIFDNLVSDLIQIKYKTEVLKQN